MFIKGIRGILDSIFLRLYVLGIVRVIPVNVWPFLGADAVSNDETNRKIGMRNIRVRATLLFTSYNSSAINLR